MILRGAAYSKTLEMETGITVLIPDNFTDSAPYRVCYLLHGMSGNHGNFLDYTLLPLYAWKHRAVFIMPEGARSLYTDMKRGQKFFSYVSDELPRICRRVFNLSAKREDTAIMGVSMGGYGALKCALANPGQYGNCCAFSSPCLFLDEGLTALRTPEGVRAIKEAYSDQLYRDFLAIFGDELACDPDSVIMELARKAARGASKPRIYSACGDKDGLVAENRRFAGEMGKTGLDFTYEEWAGDHDWTFFDAALKKALEWCYAPAR